MAVGRWIPGYEREGKARRLQALAEYNSRPRVRAVQGAIIHELKRKAMNAKQVAAAVGISPNRAAQELGALIDAKTILIVGIENKVSDKKRGRKVHTVRIYKAARIYKARR